MIETWQKHLDKGEKTGNTDEPLKGSIASYWQN